MKWTTFPLPIWVLCITSQQVRNESKTGGVAQWQDTWLVCTKGLGLILTLPFNNKSNQAESMYQNVHHWTRWCFLPWLKGQFSFLHRCIILCEFLFYWYSPTWCLRIIHSDISLCLETLPRPFPLDNTKEDSPPHLLHPQWLIVLESSSLRLRCLYYISQSPLHPGITTSEPMVSDVCLPSFRHLLSLFSSEEETNALEAGTT